MRGSGLLGMCAVLGLACSGCVFSVGAHRTHQHETPKLVVVDKEIYMVDTETNEATKVTKVPESTNN